MDGTRERLRRRPDVRDADIDDIVGIASELQEADAGRVAVEDVERVASELDVDPRYVDEAIAELARRRAIEAETRSAADAARVARARRVRSAALALGAGTAAVVALVGLGVGGSALLASSSLRAADLRVVQAEAALDAVLDRQERLVPQLVALAGGGAAALPDVPDEGPMEARLAASDALTRALAAELATLPPVSDPASAQVRLNLQHELAGAENRVAVERGRLDAARAERAALEGRLGGRLARRIVGDPERR